MTSYVTTRWYRAPEILLQDPKYSQSIDMWAAGIILGELILRKPVIAGTNQDDQLNKIFNFIGTPTKEEIENIQDHEYRFILSKMNPRKGLDFTDYFTNADPDEIDLLKKLLVFDPQKRIKASEILKHPYFEIVHQPDDEPDRERISEREFEFEDYPNVTKQQIKDMIYEECLIYNFTKFKDDYFKKIANDKSVISHIIQNDNKDVVDAVDD